MCYTDFCVVTHIEELDYFQLKLYMGANIDHCNSIQLLLVFYLPVSNSVKIHVVVLAVKHTGSLTYRWTQCFIMCVYLVVHTHTQYIEIAKDHWPFGVMN